MFVMCFTAELHVAAVLNEKEKPSSHEILFSKLFSVALVSVYYISWFGDTGRTGIVSVNQPFKLKSNWENREDADRYYKKSSGSRRGEK